MVEEEELTNKTNSEPDGEDEGGSSSRKILMIVGGIVIIALLCVTLMAGASMVFSAENEPTEQADEPNDEVATVASPTPIPTATAFPTATPLPSPTPMPMPATLFIEHPNVIPLGQPSSVVWTISIDSDAEQAVFVSLSDIGNAMLKSSDEGVVVSRMLAPGDTWAIRGVIDPNTGESGHFQLYLESNPYTSSVFLPWIVGDVEGVSTEGISLEMGDNIEPNGLPSESAFNQYQSDFVHVTYPASWVVERNSDTTIFLSKSGEYTEAHASAQSAQLVLTSSLGSVSSLFADADSDGGSVTVADGFSAEMMEESEVGRELWVLDIQGDSEGVQLVGYAVITSDFEAFGVAPLDSGEELRGVVMSLSPPVP